VHNNFYFLRQLSKQLSEEISGFTVVSCFSQNKDELVIEFNNGHRSFFIKAGLLPGFSCLSFPEKFHRAKKNSIDLFNEILMKKVISVWQHPNERSFSLRLEDNYSLLFKMHGHHSNIILFTKDDAIRMFKNNLLNDAALKLSKMDRNIDWSREAFEKNRSELEKHYFTLGSRVWHYLQLQGFPSVTAERQWQMMLEVKEKLEQPQYYLVSQQGNLFLSLLALPEVIQRWDDPIRAVNEFYHTYATHQALQSEKTIIRKHLHDQIKSGEHYIAKNEKRLNELLNDHHYQTWADLLMAHMHEMAPGLAAITLPDFHTGQPVAIKLKPALNAQKNAAIYYRKARNRQIEIDTLQKSIATKQQELSVWKELLAHTEAADALKDLQRLTRQVPPLKKQTIALAYYEFEFKGFKIWVGKNARANDDLTLKYSYKEDLWLHAKDAAGSHVVIKHQAGKNFPKEVIERAAQLAAYHSKRKTDTLCPVAYTPKKFVRKRKGDPAGMMVVEREKVILVEPKR
jgi:predicted ribosome quality control (RQC) complex YloA/Tae2 family protein